MSEDKSDLTYIGDLEEFTHEEDPAIDSLFNEDNGRQKNVKKNQQSLDDLDDGEEFENEELAEAIANDEGEFNAGEVDSAFLQEEDDDNSNLSAFNDSNDEITLSEESLNLDSHESESENSDEIEVESNFTLDNDEQSTEFDSDHFDSNPEDLGEVMLEDSGQNDFTEKNETFFNQSSDSSNEENNSDLSYLENNGESFFDENTTENTFTQSDDFSSENDQVSDNEEISVISEDDAQVNFNEKPSENEVFKKSPNQIHHQNQNMEQSSSKTPQEIPINQFIFHKKEELTQELENNKEKKWQNFKEVKSFIENYNGVSIELGGNPPFSILIEFTPSSKSASKIVDFILENKLINEKDRNLLIHNGKVLIPQISEYSAIIFSNKLRRFDAKITLGHAGDIYHSSISNQNAKGSPSVDHRRENYSGIVGNSSEVIITKNNQIKNRNIGKYLGFVHSIKVIKGTTSDENISQKIETAVEELITDLKIKASKINACAIINFERTMREVNTQHIIIEGIGNAVEFDDSSLNQESFENNNDDV